MVSSGVKVASLRALMAVLDAGIAQERDTAELLADHAGYAAVRQLPGTGPALGAVIEIGDVTRFRKPA